MVCLRSSTDRASVSRPTDSFMVKSGRFAYLQRLIVQCKHTLQGHYHQGWSCFFSFLLLHSPQVLSAWYGNPPRMVLRHILLLDLVTTSRCEASECVSVVCEPTILSSLFGAQTFQLCVLCPFFLPLSAPSSLCGIGGEVFQESSINV